MQIEFFCAEDSGEIIINENGKTRTLESNDSLIDKLISILEADYPKAHKALIEQYGKAFNYKYLAVRRFIHCNFSRLDNVMDLDEGHFNFEQISCPMRGECKWDGIICKPEFSTDLTERELQVLKLLAQGIEESAIADQLFISIRTVGNHRSNIYKKLKISSKTEAAHYCRINKINL